MRTRQVTDRHQKLIGDFSPGKFEGFPEQPDPLVFGERVMRPDPAREATMGLSHGQDDLRIHNGSVDLESIANNARIGQ